MTRPLRIQFGGALYHLVVRAHHRQALFSDNEDKQQYLDLLQRYRGRFNIIIYAFSILTREVHLLLETPNGDVSKIMQCLGTGYTQYYNRRYRRRGPLFEGRYKSYIIHKETYLSDLTRYIHRAHFRSSLNARRRRDYPWSSYRAYLGRELSDLLGIEAVLSKFGTNVEDQRRRYQRYVEDGRRGNPYPARIIAQQIVGPVEFVEKMLSDFQDVRVHGERSALKKAERILRALSLSLSPEEYLRLKERRSRALLRHVAMYVIRRQTMLPLRAIGAMLGVKASAVALAIVRLENRLKEGSAPPLIKTLLNSASFLPMPVRDELPVYEKVTKSDAGNS